MIPGSATLPYSRLNAASPLSQGGNLLTSHMVSGSIEPYTPVSSLNNLCKGGHSLKPFPWGQGPQYWSPNIITNQSIRSYNGNKSKGMRLMCWNKGSSFLHNKMTAVKQLLNDKKPHVLALTEAELTQEAKLTDVTIEGYTLYTDGLYSAGMTARTCVYVHKDIVAKQWQDLQSPHLSLVALTLGHPRQKKINILSFYRQWSVESTDRPATATITQQAAQYFEITRIWLQSIMEGRETITLSDSNLSLPLLTNQDNLSDYDRNLKPIAQHFVNDILPLGVAILNDKPTHKQVGQKPVTIDHMTSTHPGHITNVTTINTGESDHAIVTGIRHTKAPVTHPMYRSIRDYRGIDKMEMNTRLFLSQDIRMSTVETDPTEANGLFTRGIMTILDRLAPIKRIQCKKKTVPFISAETRSLQRARDGAQVEAWSTDNPDDWRQYRQLRNRANQSIKNDQHKYLTAQIEDKGPMTMWGEVKRITGKVTNGAPTLLSYGGSIITSPAKIAMVMNTFYIEKINKIRASLPPATVNPLDALKRLISGKNLKNTFSIKPVSRIQLRKLISKMKPSRSAGPDGLNMKMIKDYLPTLEPAIHNIVNQSILQNTFPSNLKISKVLPQLKSGESPTSPNSFRPINIQSPLAKIIEKVVFHQIAQHLDRQKLIPHNVHGSRPHHSPVTALISLYDNVIEKYEAGEVTAVIGLDQSAAFNVVDHQLLVARLELIGFDNNSLKWMKSYLSDRHQLVEIQGFQSDIIPHPPTSIIQGSVGSCILFNIFVMDIPQVLHPHDPHTPKEEARCPNGTTIGFVDDQSLRISGSNRQMVQNQAQISVDRLESHLTSNKLKFNKDKSNIILVAKPSIQKEGIQIQAAGKIIQSKQSLKLLGIVLSDDMKFNKQVNIMIGQLTNRLISIRQISKYASSKTIKTICQSILLGKIYYAIQLYGSLPDFLARKIQTIILQAARLVLGPKSARLSTSKILCQVGWMSYRQYEQYFTLRLAHQVLTVEQPESLVSMIGDIGPRTTRSQASGARILPPWNKSVSRDSFRYRAIKYYNDLPSDVKETKQKISRNKRIKQHVMSTVSPYIGGRNRAKPPIRLDAQAPAPPDNPPPLIGRHSMTGLRAS